MSQNFLGQVSIYGFNFAPRGWAFCAAQLLPISQNAALFALLGTTYGGDGVTTFALPDFRGRVPMGFGNTTSLGELSGTENVTLSNSEMPTHRHAFHILNTLGTATGATGNFFAEGVIVKTSTPAVFYQAGANNNVTLNPSQVSNVGGNQPHNNLQPLLAVNFCIALEGIFPSRN